MRTKIIPAQITTVEDKIAGNLNLTQILILMVPVFTAAFIYILFPPAMHLVWYKFALIIAVTAICIILSLRIQGKVVLNWLAMLFKFHMRSKYYVFDKNDSFMRTMYVPIVEKKSVNYFPFAMKLVSKVFKRKLTPSVNPQHIPAWEQLIDTNKLNIRFKSERGGLNVAFEQVGT